MKEIAVIYHLCLMDEMCTLLLPLALAIIWKSKQCYYTAYLLRTFCGGNSNILKMSHCALLQNTLLYFIHKHTVLSSLMNWITVEYIISVTNDIKIKGVHVIL